MSMVFMQQNQKGGAPPPTQLSIQKMLDENALLIQTIIDYQSKGRATECEQQQHILHRNLVYLASVADANLNVQTLLPPPSPATVSPGSGQAMRPSGPMASSGTLTGPSRGPIGVMPPQAPQQYMHQAGGAPNNAAYNQQPGSMASQQSQQGTMGPQQATQNMMMSQQQGNQLMPQQAGSQMISQGQNSLQGSQNTMMPQGNQNIGISQQSTAPSAMMVPSQQAAPLSQSAPTLMTSQGTVMSQNSQTGMTMHTPQHQQNNMMSSHVNSHAMSQQNPTQSLSMPPTPQHATRVSQSAPTPPNSMMPTPQNASVSPNQQNSLATSYQINQSAGMNTSSQGTTSSVQNAQSITQSPLNTQTSMTSSSAIVNQIPRSDRSQMMATSVTNSGISYSANNTRLTSNDGSPASSVGIRGQMPPPNNFRRPPISGALYGQPSNQSQGAYLPSTAQNTYPPQQSSYPNQMNVGQGQLMSHADQGHSHQTMLRPPMSNMGTQGQTMGTAGQVAPGVQSQNNMPMSMPQSAGIPPKVSHGTPNSDQGLNAPGSYQPAMGYSPQGDYMGTGQRYNPYTRPIAPPGGPVTHGSGMGQQQGYNYPTQGPGQYS